MECALWSLQVEDAGEGGGGISILDGSMGLASTLLHSPLSLSQKVDTPFQNASRCSQNPPPHTLLFNPMFTKLTCISKVLHC